MNNKTSILCLAITLMLALSACKTDTVEDSEPKASNRMIHEETLKDGTRCVIYRGIDQGGITCDWNGDRDV